MYHVYIEGGLQRISVYLTERVYPKVYLRYSELYCNKLIVLNCSFAPNQGYQTTEEAKLIVVHLVPYIELGQNTVKLVHIFSDRARTLILCFKRFFGRQPKIFSVLVQISKVSRCLNSEPGHRGFR